MTKLKDEIVVDCDGLKNLDQVCVADERNNYFVRIDVKTGVEQSLTIADLYESVSEYILIDEVPDKVRIQFDTARNLYLYSWYVYRFYNIAEDPLEEKDIAEARGGISAKAYVKLEAVLEQYH